MIDYFITRPVLKAVTFIKRHPVLFLLIVLLLWLVPPFLTALFQGILWFIGKALGWFGEKTGEAIRKALTQAYTWIAGHPVIFSILISVVMPFGWIISLWMLMDKLKKGPDLTIVPQNPAIPGPDATPPDVELPKGPVVGSLNPFYDIFGRV